MRPHIVTDTADAVPHDLDAVEWSDLFGPTSTAV